MNLYHTQVFVSFPQEVKECLSQADPEKCQHKLADALVTKSTRDTFKAWANQHPSFVRQSPLMNSIVKAIEIKECSQPGIFKEFTQKCLSLVRAVIGEWNSLAPIIEQHQYYDFTDRKNFEDIKKSLPFFEEYLELGLIHKNQLVQALSIQSKEFGHTPIHPLIATSRPRQINESDLWYNSRVSNELWKSEAEAKNLHKLIPLLKHLSPDELIQIFSIRDAKGWPSLFYQHSFENILPFLQTLPMDLLANILAIRSRCDTCLLKNDEIAVKALVLLSNRSNPEQEAFFNSLAMYPLTWASIFKHTLPFLEKMPPEQQARILSSQPNGLSLLQQETGVKAAWPLIVKFPSALFIKVMTSKNRNNQQPLDFITHLDSSILNKMNEDQRIHLLSKATPKLFKDIWDSHTDIKGLKSHQQLQILCSIAAEYGNHEEWKDIFKDMDPLFSNSDLMRVMASANEKHKTLLHSEVGLVAALPILKKLRSHEIVDLLSNQDATGSTPLHSLRGFAMLKPLLERLSPDDSLHLLTIKDANGICPLVRLTSVSYAWPFLKKMNLEQSIKFLSLAPLNIFAGVIAYPCYKNLSNEELVQIITTQAALGKSVYWKEAFAAAKPKIEKLASKQFIQILSAKDPSGDPLVFTKHGFEAISPHLKTMPAELQQKVLSIQNADGLSRNDLTTYTISGKWLKCTKTSAAMSASISYEDYNTRVGSLKTKVNALWDTMSHGLNSGKVNPKLLEVNGKLYSSFVIMSKLNAMIDLMVNKQAWLGTPLLIDALHRFYSVMLVNFERVAIELEKRDNPVETAGFLTSIAAVSLEGRCASAYQAEIAQKSEALSENMDLNSFVKKAASNSLADLIETIIRIDYGSDVHYLNQFHYAAGLASASDHLASISPEMARASIERHFTFADFYRAFGHGISNEHAMEWLKGNTPGAFGPEYKEMENKFREKEELILKESEEHLREFFSAGKAINLSQFLTIPPAPALPVDELKIASQKELLKKTLQQVIDRVKGMLQKDFSIPDIAQLYTLIMQAKNEEESQEIVKDLIQKIKANLDKTNMPDYLRNLQIVGSLSGKLPEDVKKIVSFDKAMGAAQLTPKQLLYFLRVKQTYDSKIEQLGTTLEDSPLSIVFVPSTHRLPSLACDYARRLKYNEDLMTSRAKMLLHILKELGAIEKRTEKSRVQQVIDTLSYLMGWNN